MHLEEQLTAKIKQVLPDFNFISTKVITHGWNDIVLIANESTVFTFPRDMDDSREQLQTELQLLPLLQKQVSLPVPNFTFVAPDQAFASYPLIPGEPLSPNIYSKLSAPEQIAAATAVGKFLRELHNVSVDSALACGVQDAWSIPQADAWLKKRQATIRTAAKSPEELDKLEKLLNQVRTRAAVTERVLTHNDLSPDHILFDAKQKFVTGIIDFGDAQFDDPAVDFGKLWELGENFVDQALAAYGNTTADFKLRTKLHFIHYSLANLYYGLTQPNENYLERGRRILNCLS